MVANENILIFDGACGTNLQAMDLPESAWGGRAGCTEFLNVSAPEAIVDLHAMFVDAGAQVIETNTLGCNPTVLAEYDLVDRLEELTAAAVANARSAIGSREGHYIAGSIGPGTRLPSLGQIDVDSLVAGYTRQIRVLIEEGVDLLLIETCQDLLHVKTMVRTCREISEQLGRPVPISVSVTLEETGTMLVGADIAAVAAALEPLGLFSLGLNCATGPEGMASHVHYLSRRWPGRISVIPNAGMPEVSDGKVAYNLSPADFAACVKGYVQRDGVSMVGGCCGTRPEHIRALADALRDVQPGPRSIDTPATLSSGYQAVEVRQDIPPMIIGERTNAHGSKAFREKLKADDFDGALAIGLQQERSGAHAVDLCAAYAGRDETADLTRLTRLFAESIKVPVVLDTTNPDALAAALAVYPGRCVINSINLEDGGASADRVCQLAKAHGAAVVALTIDADGMAKTADRKLAIARKLYQKAVGEHGLRPQDLLFDPLTFTIASGEQASRSAGLETLEGIGRIKAEFPDSQVLLGLSNISFGLPKHARHVLNSVFLARAVDAGVDVAIVDPAKMIALDRIPAEQRELCEKLIDNDRADGDPLMALIEHFEEAVDRSQQSSPTEAVVGAEAALTEKVLSGDGQDLDELLAALLVKYAPAEIINQILLPAMQTVGERFGAGEMLLPFVLQSAETMKRSVRLLEPHMDAADTEAGSAVLLATVAGDVHDIGKNLVGIILSNNGYRVYDEGIKVPAETIVAKAQAHNVAAIGLSGLLVKSALGMQDVLKALQAAGLSVPVLLGGAALTRKYVAESCAPLYDGPVVYCPDAFAGLRAVQQMEAGTLTSTTADNVAASSEPAEAEPATTLTWDHPTPRLPREGVEHLLEIGPAEVLPFVNEQALFRWRWGYRKGEMSDEEYDKLLDETVRPLYQDLQRRSLHEGLVRPKAAIGTYRCRRDGDRLIVDAPSGQEVFAFPRQSNPPHRSLADYFRSADQGGDVLSLMIVTVGGEIGQEIQRLYERDAYRDYLVLHGFSVEMTEALAECIHDRVRRQLGIEPGGRGEGHVAVVRSYPGRRYSFGYAACPDLSQQEKVVRLLAAEQIGVRLSEGYQMVPEQSVSALIVHHPQAQYFSV